jgi:oxygen-dependent protoporphyrinogen oxidase
MVSGRIAIIGGGWAGIFAARAVAAAGAKAVIYEASPALGGKVASKAESGFLTEDGPNAIAGAPQLQKLAGGARLNAPMPARRFVFRGGRLRSAPGAGLVSPVGLLRTLVEPLIARRGPASVEEGDESLLSFFRRHLGGEAGALAARLVAAGVFAGDPARLGVRAFPNIAALESGHRSLLLGAVRSRGEPGRDRALWSVRGGLGALGAQLAEGVEVRLGERVEAMAPVGRGWQLSLAGGVERADGVVLAVPAPAAALLLEPASPPLAAALGAIRYAPLAVVHLGIPREAISHPCQGFGMLDGSGKLTVLGTLFLSSLFPDRAPPGQVLLTSMVGGALAPERAALPDGELVDAVCADLRGALGLGGSPSYHRVVRHPQAIPQYEVGHFERVKALRALSDKLPSLALAGAAYDGVGVPDVAASGQRAAEAILGNAPTRIRKPR